MHDYILVLISLVIGIMGWFMKEMWQSHKDQTAHHGNLVAKVHSVEVMVAMQCIRRDEFSSAITKLEENLDHNFEKVFEKLDRKADK
jgi:hypothetical protein